MDLFEEFRKALAGQESRVTLETANERIVRIENLRHSKGYRGCFGSGFSTREELVERLRDARDLSASRNPLKK